MQQKNTMIPIRQAMPTREPITAPTIEPIGLEVNSRESNLMHDLRTKSVEMPPYTFLHMQFSYDVF